MGSSDNKSDVSNDNGTMIEFDKVSIRNKLLILPNSFMQISNISRVSAHEFKSPSYVKAFFLLVLAVIIAVVAIENFKKLGGAVFFLGLFTLWALAGVYVHLTTKKVGVHIQTNGNTSDLLITNDRETSIRLYSMIAYYIANEVNESVTIDNSLNVTYGDSVLGDKFSDIENSEVINRSNVN